MWPFRKRVASVEEPVAQTEAVVVQNDAAPSTYPLTDSEAWLEFFGGGQRFGGQIVNEDTAMRASAVFACVRLISAAISCAPVKIYRRRKGGLRDLWEDHPLAEVLRIRPNRFMTAATFWKGFTQDKLLLGNAYAHIIRMNDRTPVALYPVQAKNVVVYYAWELGLDKKLGVEQNRLFYDMSFPDGRRQVYDQDDVLHVPNVGWNGKYGISTIRSMAETVGLDLGAKRSSSTFFENGMRPDFSISFQGKPEKDAMDRFREHLQSRYSGAGNHHKPLVLYDSGKVDKLSMTAEDAQLLESRKFSVIDICRFFGVHPVMIGENEKTSSFGGGIEQMGRWFNTLTLNEHFTATEQELERKLGCFAEFDETELTRGDTKTRAEFYNVMRGSLTQPQLLTVNEIRAAEGYGPKPGGDDLFVPENQSTAAGTDASTGDGNAAQ